MYQDPTVAVQQLQQTYRQNRHAIEQRLRTEIEQFRSERDKLNPRSPHEAERWSADIYTKLLQRREYLLRILSSEACTA